MATCHSLSTVFSEQLGDDPTLLRAEKASCANAASDDVNYDPDSEPLDRSAVESFGGNPDSVDFAGDLAAEMLMLSDTLVLVETNGEGLHQGGEIIDGVLDVNDAAEVSNDNLV